MNQQASLLAGMSLLLESATVIQLPATKIVMEKGGIPIHLTPSRISKLIAQPVGESPQYSRHPPF